MTPKAKAKKRKKIGKLNFCVSKDSINQVKRQPTAWDKVFANHVSNRRLTSRIYKGFLQQLKNQHHN